MPRLAILALALGAVVIAFTGRVFYDAKTAYSAAVEAQARGELDAALDGYQLAMRRYLPLTDAPQEAAKALQALGQAARDRGDRATALAAYRRLRGGIRATQGLWFPFEELAAETDLALAALTAEEQLSASPSTVRGRTPERLASDHLALLSKDPTPSRWASLWVVVSFWVWVLGGFALAFKGLSPELRPVPRRFYPLLALTVAGLGLWLTGLAIA